MRPALTSYSRLAFRIASPAIAGHQKLTYCSSIFVHARDTVDRQALIPGSKVSFTYEADEKGGKAKDVAVEEIAESVTLDEAPREMGTVKVRLAASVQLSLRSARIRGFLREYNAFERRSKLRGLNTIALECRQRLRIHWTRK